MEEIQSTEFNSPVTQVAVGEGLLAAASGSLDRSNCVTVLDSETLDIRAQLPTQFVASSVQFEPSKGGFPIALGGEAIAIWDVYGNLSAYCVPELFQPTWRAGPGESPIWSIVHLEWNQPEVLLACHRSGSINLYPVERLPSSVRPGEVQSSQQKAAESGVPSGSSPGLWARVAQSLFGTQASHDHEAAPPSTNSGPVSTPVAQPVGIPRPTQFYTCAKYLGSPSKVVAARNGTSALQLLDLTAKPDTPAWECAVSGISKICVQPVTHPHHVVGLDRQAGMIYIFDTRKADLGILQPDFSHSASDLFGEHVLVNDIAWGTNDQLVFALQRKPTAPLRDRFHPLGALSVTSLMDARSHEAAVKYQVGEASTKRWYTPLGNQFGTAVATAKSNHIVLGWSTFAEEEFEPTTLPLPPMAGSALRTARFTATKNWRLTYGPLDGFLQST
eukprot:Protomagalhaensia_sp_Gyna_25__1867@NODE_198_length_4488_cov_14_125646_g153_i0_p2_GENE_NODE_198_length_4488_cov_14_125646_g153_i0NODE_198_length_4488_cov_14_125646_g153_i0_p2_ORF_typecomplete_len445_score66_27CRT10/PF08728_10/0_13_NODE_198_length_4488_cov_14_125646_g153_i08722206